ncbi:MAG: dephospho-CoA kinase [Bacteroidales bacterium]
MKVGVSGGIGSGKSSVCKVFGTLGIPVFEADEEARKITESDEGVKKSLCEIAGTDLYISGSLDRKLLASLIFNNRSMLKEVNRLVHPMVFQAFGEWAGKQDAPYVIMEAAILFESGAYNLVDKTIVVTAPDEERLERVSSRSGMTISEVSERMRNQHSQDELAGRADYVIKNGDKDLILPAIIEIHKDLLKRSKTNRYG